MKDTKFRILLDIHEVRSQVTIPVKVGDVSCKIYITLVEGGKPYKIHENSFGVFTGKKGDDNYIFNNCIVENGIIRYDFTPQTVAAAGVLECEVRIYDEDGGVLTTPSFNIVVDERAVNDSELASASEFAFLDEILVNEGQRIENERNRNEAFNKLGIDLEDDGEVISIVKTDIDGSQEKASFLKYADVIPPVTATATGSAITIESANAPLQNLKLYGSTVQNGTPTPTSPIELKSIGDSGSYEVGVYGKNLIDVSSTTQTINGITFTVNADKSITVNGTATAYTRFMLHTVSYFIYPKGNYAFNGNKANSNLLLKVFNNTTQTAYVDSGNGGNFSLNDGDMFTMFITVDSGATINTTIYPMIIHESVTDTTFEPCNKQTLIINDTLRGIGDIVDEIDFARGVLVQRFEKIDLGTLTWTMGQGTSLTYFSAFLPNYNFPTSMSNSVAPLLCSHYKAVAQRERSSPSICGSSGAVNQILITDTSYTSAEEFKTAMSGVYVVYELETPIETPLTETELNDYRQLMTNKGTTTILSEAEVEVDYYINKPNAQAIGNIHSQLNKDYFKLQQAIIETGGN